MLGFVLFSTFLVVGVSQGTVLEEQVTRQCPQALKCNGEYVLTLQSLRDNKLECRNYHDYARCVLDHLTTCHSEMPSVPENSTMDPESLAALNSSGMELLSASQSVTNILNKGTDLCAMTPMGVVTVTQQDGEDLLSLYTTSETCVAFEDYPMLQLNLSVSVKCDDLSGCASIMEPYTNFSDKCFPCTALMNYGKCYQQNEAGCLEDPDMYLAPVRQRLAESLMECQVGGASSLHLALSVLLSTLLFAVKM